VLGDRDAAEDVAQDAFLVALRRAADFDMTATFAPWFFGIVRRLAQKTRSRERRRWHLLERWHARDSAALGEVASANLQFEDVRSAIRDLPPMQRACCELAFVHGIAPEQIAAMHDISPSTVRQHIFRGRQRLRALLSEHRGEENQR
jgi:RNA polymerase sigma-70 factor (ECF subfamily)